MNRTLDGATVLVTGAGSGIGRAVVQEASRQGARTVLVDVDERSLAEAAAASGGRGHVMDVGDEAEWWRLAASETCWDHVILNAGIMSAPPGAALAESDLRNLDVERYRRVLSVNIDGVVFGLRAMLPRLAQRGGSVVVTASVAGLVPYRLDPAYTLTKHAVVGLVRSMAGVVAADHRAGRAEAVRIQAICPAGVDTGLVPTNAPAVELMPPEVVAEDIIDLCLHGENGEVRARTRADQPAQTVAPPTLDGWGS